MLLSHKLEKMAHDYEDARCVVSLYLLEQGERIADRTMSDVAVATHTSKPTLVRVAKQLGFSGWKELSRAWERELRDRERRVGTVDHNLPFGPNDDDPTIYERLCALHAESALLTAQALDPAALAKAVRLMTRARRIALFGVSVNHLMLQLFYRKCLITGIEALLVPQNEFGHTARQLGVRDCALIVSYTGESPTREPMLRIPDLKARGVPIVAITSEGQNYLRDQADVALTMTSRESLYGKIANFSTEESTLCILDALYGCLFARSYERNLRTKDTNTRAVEADRQPE